MYRQRIYSGNMHEEKNGDCLSNDPGSNDKRAKARKRGNRKTIKSYNLS